MPKQFTPESAALAKEAAELQKNIYSRKFLEDDRWRELAKDAGVTLPPFFARPSDSGIKSALRRLGVSWNLFVEAYGWESSEHFERLNPKWGMRPLTGLILELWDEKNRLKEACYNMSIERGAAMGGASPRKERMPRGVAKAKRAPLKQPLDSNDVVV